MGACSIAACRHAGWGVAHLSTCTSPLFSHSLFTSSLPQTFHPLLLRTIEGPGRSPVCSVVVNVEASARTCLNSWLCFGVTEDLPPFALVKLIAPSTNFLKSFIYFYIHYIWIATLPYFYFDLWWPLHLAMRQARFRVARISFYIGDYTFTTKYSRTVSK